MGATLMRRLICFIGRISFTSVQSSQNMSRPPSPPENAEHPRLSKRMGELGLCSRREAEHWITNGWVKVDGVVVDTLGTRVSLDARIEVDPAAREHQSGQV